MAWFTSNQRRAEELLVPEVHFLGEQDGIPEGELKDSFAQLFRESSSIKKAYLARVAYRDQTNVNVALCLLCTASFDKKLYSKIIKIFSSMFGPDEHLDIIFLKDSQESELTKVCLPFFISSKETASYEHTK